MVTALYASLAALLVVKLSIAVIKLRRTKRISIGDGENKELALAVRAHANALEYIPVTLLLLLTLEINGAPKLLIHALGLTMLAGRILHAVGFPVGDLKKRVLGMQITLYLLLGLAILNVAYLPFAKLF